MTLISPTDPPLGRLPWAWVARLAEAVRRLVTFAQERPEGRVAGLVANASNLTTSSTTELVGDYVNFIPNHAGRYRLEWGAVLKGTVDTDAYNVVFRLQQTAGALTTSGTQIYIAQVNGGVVARREFHAKTFVGLTPGSSYAAGVTLQRVFGSGTLSALGHVASERTLDVFHVAGS